MSKNVIIAIVLAVIAALGIGVSTVGSSKATVDTTKVDTLVDTTKVDTVIVSDSTDTASVDSAKSDSAK